MEIHKPKPWHGWREFGKELSTIVLGVLIALGAEQGVEWVHRQHEVAETREALADEISLNLRNINYSIVEDRCLDGHMTAWTAWAKGGPKPQFSAAALPRLASAAWDVAKSGSLAHMPLRERLAYTRFYNDLDTLQTLKSRTGQVLMSFTGYAAEDRLSAAQAQEVLPILATERVLMGREKPIADRLLQEGAALGVKPSTVEPSMRARLVAICREVGIEPSG